MQCGHVPWCAYLNKSSLEVLFFFLLGSHVACGKFKNRNAQIMTLKTPRQ